MQHSLQITHRTERRVSKALQPLDRIAAKYKEGVELITALNTGYKTFPSSTEQVRTVYSKLNRFNDGLLRAYETIETKTDPKYGEHTTDSFNALVTKRVSPIIKWMGITTTALTVLVDIVLPGSIAAIGAVIAGFALASAGVVKYNYRKMIEEKPEEYILQSAMKLIGNAGSDAAKIREYFVREAVKKIGSVLVECRKMLANHNFSGLEQKDAAQERP